ncbi:hypothetical protein PROFUN_17011, partial [Planoprotostelium fungivorum]
RLIELFGSYVVTIHHKDRDKQFFVETDPKNARQDRDTNFYVSADILHMLVTIKALDNKYKLSHKVPGRQGWQGCFAEIFRFASRDIAKRCQQIFGNNTSPTSECEDEPTPTSQRPRPSVRFGRGITFRIFQRIQALPVGANFTESQKSQYFDRYLDKDENYCDGVHRFKPNAQDLIDHAVGLYPSQTAPTGPLWFSTGLSGSSSRSGGPGVRFGCRKTERYLKLIATEMVIQKRKRLDIWTPSKRTLVDSTEFKNSLISYYDRKDPRSSDIKCMVLDRFYPRDKVRGSHIWKYATYGEGLDEFGLKEDDVNKERNGLLLGEGIELAFDIKQLCFLYDPINTKFIVKVLDPGLLQSSTPVSPSQTRTFSDINNLPLCLPAGRSPFRRLLSWHAECTYTTALKKTWIDQPAFDTFTTYDSLSNGARPDFLEDLDNEE